MDQKKSRFPNRTKMKQQGDHTKNAFKKDNKMTLWFELDDTGCGMSKANHKRHDKKMNYL